MAMLDSSDIKDSVHKGLCFLDVVRSAYLAIESPRLPIAAQCCYARLYLMKSDKPRRPSSGFGKLVLVKKAWSPFNLALGGEGTVRDSCYLFDSSDMRVMLRISDSLRFRHHHPPPPTRRRGGSTVFHSRHQRFHERPGSASSPRRHRLDGQHDPDLYSSTRQRFGRGSRGGRADGRSREVYTAYRGSVSEGGYIHGNDPNLTPQEGDWVYHAPYCGNLNFARRTHRNNCNKHRYGPQRPAPNHTSWGASFRGSPPRTFDPTGCVPRHDFHRYESLPHHGWGVEDPRMPPPAFGAKFAGSKRREREDYHDELEYRRRHQLDRPAALEWDGRDGNRDNRRRPISREMRRSPLVDRQSRGVVLGHGRDDELNMAQTRG